MPLSIFGHNPKTVSQDCIGSKSKFDHTFGGRAEDFGIEFEKSPLALHLIYRLDLADPELPCFGDTIDFLPLLQCYNYGTECCYKVLSDHRIELLSPVDKDYYFPPWDAPESFVLRTTSFTRLKYDPGQCR